jgi:hypothetical protein
VRLENASHIFITDQEDKSHKAIMTFLGEVSRYAKGVDTLIS